MYIFLATNYHMDVLIRKLAFLFIKNVQLIFKCTFSHFLIHVSLLLCSAFHY